MSCRVLLDHITGNLDEFKRLLNDRDYTYHFSTTYHENLVHFAVRSDCPELVKYLVEKTEINLDAPNIIGIYPIGIILELKNIRMVEALILSTRPLPTGGLDFNRIIAVDDLRMFMGIAVQLPYAEPPLLQKVIESTSFPNLQNSKKQTFLHAFVYQGCYKTFTVLLQNPKNLRRFDLSLVNSDGFTCESYIRHLIRTKGESTPKREALNAIKAYQMACALPSEEALQEEVRLTREKEKDCKIAELTHEVQRLSNEVGTTSKKLRQAEEEKNTVYELRFKTQQENRV